MHNLAALARRYEDKWAAERATAAAPSLPRSCSCDRSPNHRLSRPDDELPVNSENTVSLRDWSVPTNRFSDKGSGPRPLSTRSSTSRRCRRERDAKRVLVVPLDPAVDGPVHEADNAHLDAVLSTTFHTPSTASAPPLSTAPKSPHPQTRPTDLTRVTQRSPSQRQEPSPMPSLAWIPSAPLTVSPAPLSLAAQEDHGWNEVEVNLSASITTTTATDSENDSISDGRTHAEMTAPSNAPVLIDFYVERDDAPLPGVPTPARSVGTYYPTTYRDGQAHDKVVRLRASRLPTSRGLKTPTPPKQLTDRRSRRPDVPENSERALFRHFLDDVTGTGAEEGHSVEQPRPSSVPAADSIRRLSGLHESALAEVNHLQWELVEELCCAVRPFAKVLLLNLMTAAEAECPVTAHPSKVPVRCCVETMNTLLAQHGLDGPHATQLLCQRVADYGCEAPSRDHSPEAAASPPTERDGLVEYATFVSHVLEIAHAADAANA